MQRLVVGADGTDASAAALGWAADVVGATGSLHVILALDPLAEYVVDLATGDREGFNASLRHRLETEWVDPVRTRVAELTTTVAELSAPTALSIAMEELRADAVVVGAHVTHGAPSRIGRTTRRLLRKLPGPLVVVPSTVGEGLPADRPIVVGIGRGEATDAAVRWAAHLADQRSLPVALVHATGESPVFDADGIRDLVHAVVHPEDRVASTADELVRRANEVQELSDHELLIHTAAPPGLSALRLTEASSVASLLVVGQHWSSLTRGHHTPQPLRYALTHAHCPVAVIPEWTVTGTSE